METQKTLLEQTVTYFLSAFKFPGLDWKLILIAVALGLAFGVLWLLAYRPSLKKTWTLVIIGIAGAFLTWIGLCFIQVPLQTWSGQALLHFWDEGTLSNWVLLANIPLILLSGIVQEGTKLIPVVFYWLRNGRNIDPMAGLIAGAVAGAGFGVFEAVWAHNTIFAAGWTWQAVQLAGFPALVDFLERFFAVGFHIAVSALAGYGLARGKGWQFYLLAAFIHGVSNYSIILMQTGLLSSVGFEIYIIVNTIALAAIVLWLRWRRTSGQFSELRSETYGARQD
jgi:RsiW-degrading membrane proteinase PrsW (M82 family)